MFELQDGRGFTMKFDNGWTVSVKWGAGNYCSNYNQIGYRMSSPVSVTAEVAAWDKDGNWHIFYTQTFNKGTEDEFSYDQKVAGWLSADKVLAFMNEIANK